MHVEDVTILQEIVLTLERERDLEQLQHMLKYGRARSQKSFHTKLR